MNNHISNIKEKFNKSFHIDIAHDSEGQYMTSSNSQRYNSPTGINTIGRKGVL